MTRGRHNRRTWLAGVLLAAAIFSARPHVAVAGPQEQTVGLPAGARLRIKHSEPQNGQAAVYAVAFSPDGSRLATRGSDGVVRLWDPASGQCLATLDERLRTGKTLEFAPAGTHVAAGSGDEAVYVWDTGTGKLAHTVPGGGALLRFLPEPLRLAILDRDHLVEHKLDDAEASPRRHAAPSCVLALSCDTKLAAAVPRWGDALLRVHELDRGKKLADLTGCQSQPSAVAFSPDSQTLAAGGRDQAVHLWQIERAGQPRQSFSAGGSTVHTLAFSPSGRLLACGASDGSVRVFELTGAGEARTFLGHQGPVASVAFSPREETLASAGVDGRVMLWDVSPASLAGEEVAAATSETAPTAWEDLDSPSPQRGLRAVAALAAAPEVALPLLREQLDQRLGGSQLDQIRKWIAALDDDDFQVREQATAELQRVADLAEPLLRRALETTTSAEVRFRIRRILEASGGSTGVVLPDERRWMRVLHLLDRLHTPEARTLVEQIAGAARAKRIVHQARDTLARW